MNQNPVRGVFRLQASFHGKIRLLSKKILCHQKLIRGLVHMGDGPVADFFFRVGKDMMTNPVSRIIIRSVGAVQTKGDILFLEPKFNFVSCKA